MSTVQSVPLTSRTFQLAVNGCYRVTTTNLEWSVAGLECRRLHRDAHLLVINDAAEQRAIAGMLASTNRQCHFVFFSTVSLFIQTTVSLAHNDTFP